MKTFKRKKLVAVVCDLCGHAARGMEAHLLNDEWPGEWPDIGRDVQVRLAFVLGLNAQVEEQMLCDLPDVCPKCFFGEVLPLLKSLKRRTKSPTTR